MPTALSPFVGLEYQKIMDAACEFWYVTWDDLRSSKKPRDLACARVDIAVALRAHGWSFPLIAMLLHKHHSAIVLMVQRAKKRPPACRNRAPCPNPAVIV
jgi:chromosomal replication initiation ATPase DnaA